MLCSEDPLDFAKVSMVQTGAASVAELKLLTAYGKPVRIRHQLLSILGDPQKCSIAVLQPCWKLVLRRKSVVY